jgi:hypothetical protein
MKYWEWAVLDVSKVDFIEEVGFFALQMVDTRFAETRMYWALVPSEPVNQMLRVWDSHGVLPVADSVDMALTTTRRAAEVRAATRC